jgi:hypothetical protein
MEEEKKGEKKMGEAIFLTHQNLQLNKATAT